MSSGQLNAMIHRKGCSQLTRVGVKAASLAENSAVALVAAAVSFAFTLHDQPVRDSLWQADDPGRAVHYCSNLPGEFSIKAQVT